MTRKTLMTGLAAAGLIAVGLAGTAQATEQEGPWMIRGRLIGVIPQEDSKVGVIGGNVALSDWVFPEADISYFFTDNFAVELIASTTNHTVKVNGSALGSVDLGHVWLLPPTLTAQYHFHVTDTIKPYVGVGVNYTVFYGVGGTGGFDVKYDNSFGYAFQAGVDVNVGGGWYANFDVKKIMLSTTATVNNTIKAKVDIDPWIVGVGFGYRF